MSNLSKLLKRIFKKHDSCDEKNDSDTLVIPSSLELATKMSEKFDDDAVSVDEEFDIEKFLADDMFESLRNERDRYRECLLQIDNVTDLEDRRFEIKSDEETTHYVFVRSGTTFLNVDKPGEYYCIYEYRIKPGKPAIKGEMLCIADVEQYKIFSKIKDLRERANYISYFVRCSPEQKDYIIRNSLRKENVDDNVKLDKRENRRDIITDPDTLKMMFDMCKHTLPLNLRYECQTLIKKSGSRSNSTAILADILYTCCESDPKKPFMSTKECMEVFRRKRYGDDPWIKDIIRQIRLLDRCNNSGAVFVLVGSPGTGKTEISEAIAECTHKRFCKVHCRNKNAMEIGGSHRTYAESCHGEIMENLLYYGNDCCMLLDEFEKMVITEKEGNPFALFISTWDDQKTFTDHFTLVPIPTKNVIWILTVNSIDKVPDYILNRFGENVFILDTYSAQMKAEIGRRFIVPKYMKTYNFTEQDLQFTDEGLVAIAKTTHDGGARITAQKIEKVLRAVNEQLEDGVKAPIIIDAQFALSALADTAKTIEDERHRSIGFNSNF